MIRVYQAKWEKTVQDFLDAGYDLMPEDIVQKENVVFKIMKMPLDGESVKMVLNIYNDPNWQQEYLTMPHAMEAFNELGIYFDEVFDEEGNTKTYVRETDELLEMISTWRIEIDMDGDKVLGFTTGDMSFPFTFENRNILDKFCKEEIDNLFSKSLIKIIEKKD